MNYGLDLMKGEVIDNVKAGVLEPTISKVRSLKSALEAATSLLRIDDGECFTPLFSRFVGWSLLGEMERGREERVELLFSSISSLRFAHFVFSLLPFFSRSHPSRTGAEGRRPPRRTLESPPGGEKKMGKGEEGRGGGGGAFLIERVFRLTSELLFEERKKRGKERSSCL